MDKVVDSWSIDAENVSTDWGQCVESVQNSSSRVLNGSATPWVNGSDPAVYGYGVSVTGSPTAQIHKGTENCFEDPNNAGKYLRFFGTVTEALSDPVTESDLYTEAKVYADAKVKLATYGTTVPSAYETSFDGNSVSVSRVDYRATFNVTCPREYRAYVTVTETPHGQSGPVTTRVLTDRYRLESGVRTIEGAIKIAQKDVDYTVTSIELHAPCQNFQAGTLDLRISSIHVGMGLGRALAGEFPGEILLDTDVISATTYTPTALIPAAPVGGGIEIIRDVNGALRQMKGPQSIADIVILDTTSYEVRFYTLNNVGAQDGTTLLYALSGDPFVTYKFEDPDSGANTRLRITETRGSMVRINEYAYDNATSTWSLSRGNGLRKESEIVTINGTDTTKVSIISEADNTVVSKISQTYRTYPWGEELISTIIDPDGAALTTNFVFYDDVINDGDNYGRLKQRTNSDLSWERITWLSSGRLLKVVRPWLDSAISDGDSQSRVTDYTYTALADADGDSIEEEIETTIETTLGVETSRSYEIEWSAPVTIGSEAFDRRTNIRCTESGAAWNATTNLVYETLRYNQGEFSGLTRRSLNPDGSASLSEYARDANGIQTTIQSSGEINPAGDAIVDGTLTTTITNALGYTVDSTVQDIASGLILEQWMASDFDSLGRPQRTDYVDGTYETRTYECCGLAITRDRYGRIVSYDYDALGRVEYTTQGGLTTHSIYDADNRIKSVTLIGTNGGEIVQQTNFYDLAGRLYKSRDALNRPTLYSESYDTATGQRTTTTTSPGGGTSVSVTARDGALLSVSGTAAAPRAYEYGLENGLLYTTETLIGENQATTEWMKSYTDFAGRNVLVKFADAATNQSLYNEFGQLKRQIDPDGVSTLYDYNARGQQTVAALDINRNGIIDYEGPDRIGRTASVFATKTVNSTSHIVQRTTTETWETDDDDTATTISITEQTLDGLRSWQTVRGQTSSSVTTYDGAGNHTTTSTAADTTQVTQVYIGQRLDTQTISHPTDGTLSSASYHYDQYNRPDTVTDAHTGTTTYTYYDDGQIHTVTTPDPDTTQTGPGYDPQTTSYTYGDAGRVETVTLSDDTAVHTAYWPTGQVKHTWGSRTYPQAYTYDSQGRLKTLATWQNFVDESTFETTAGKATTTWNYDPQRGWLVSKRDQSNHGADYDYSPSGRLKTRDWARTVAGVRLRTIYTYNNAGDLWTIDYADATPDVTNTYDRLGRLETTTDAAGLLTRTYENGRLDDETYTGTGLLAGQSLARTQDPMQRLKTLSVGSPSLGIPDITYGYLGAYRLHTVTRGTQSATYGYLTNSPLVETTTLMDGTTTRLTATRAYDQLNRLQTITNLADSATRSVAYGFNDANQRTKATREDNTYWSYGYDDLGQVKTAAKHEATAAIRLGQDYGYDFDTIGNRLTTTTNGNTATYSPSLLNQYDTRTVPGEVDVIGSAAADATVTVNNQATQRQGETFLGSVTVDNATGPAYATATIVGVKNNVGPLGEDAVTEITRHAYVAQTPESYTHDDDGNLTQDGRWDYTWDAENRLIAMETRLYVALASSLPRQRLEFAYDASGRRITKRVFAWNTSTSTFILNSETKFLYDGWNLVAELTRDTATSTYSVNATYVWGLDLSGSQQGAGGVGGLLWSTNDSGTQSPGYDGNGNIISWVDQSTGEITAENDYTAFGEIIGLSGTNPTPFGFSTKYQDSETTLLYYGYRYYNPSTGRWLSRDPIEESGGLNLYGMVGNDPISFVDPLGLALYAFDGTKNDGYKQEAVGNETNVFILHNLYRGNKEYLPGVGTNDGLMNVFGLAFGYGGQSRVKKMLDAAGGYIAQGDLEADIIGFSRGAAQARDFANKLKEKYPCVNIRWMGLFDTVASVGLPGNVNIGYNLTIPSGTGAVLHLTAGAERRRTRFALTSINASPLVPNPNPNYREEEMPNAVHSDVGGFYGNNRGLANQALIHMWWDGLNHGVPFNPIPAQYLNTTPNGANDSRWPDDKLVELITGPRTRKNYYHP